MRRRGFCSPSPDRARSDYPAATQNGGRHCCRPPVAGLRPAHPSSEENEPRRLVSAARSTSCRERRRSFAFRSPGPGAIPLRASAPQPRRPAQQSGPEPVPHRFGPYLSNRLPPGDERRASGHHGQRSSTIAGTRKRRFGPPLLLPRRRRSRVRTSRPSVACGPPEKARRTLRSSSLFRHKLLISLRFPASSSSAYSHDCVIESESRQW